MKRRFLTLVFALAAIVVLGLGLTACESGGGTSTVYVGVHGGYGYGPGWGPYHPGYYPGRPYGPYW